MKYVIKEKMVVNGTLIFESLFNQVFENIESAGIMVQDAVKTMHDINGVFHNFYEGGFSWTCDFEGKNGLEEIIANNGFTIRKCKESVDEGDTYVSFTIYFKMMEEWQQMKKSMKENELLFIRVVDWSKGLHRGYYIFDEDLRVFRDRKELLLPDLCARLPYGVG